MPAPPPRWSGEIQALVARPSPAPNLSRRPREARQSSRPRSITSGASTSSSITRVMSATDRSKRITQEDFEAVVNVHLMGAFHVVRPAFPIMCKAGYGRIVLTSSIGGLYGTKNVVNYGVSKAGIIGLNNIVGDRGRGEGCEEQYHPPRRRDANGRRFRHIPVSAHGARNWSRRWWAGLPTKPARSAERC